MQSTNELGVIGSQIIYNGQTRTGVLLFLAKEVACHCLKSRPKKKIFIMRRQPLRTLKGTFLFCCVFEHYACYPGPEKGLRNFLLHLLSVWDWERDCPLAGSKAFVEAT